MYCLTPSLSHVFQELLSVYLFVLGEGVPENLSVPLEGDRDFGELW